MDPNTPDEFEDDYVDNGYSGDGGEPVVTPPVSDTSTTEPDYAGDDENEEQDENQSTPQMGTLAPEVFDVLGFEGGLVDFDDREVPFSSLSAEDQTHVISERLKAERDLGFNEAQEEIGLTEQETQLLNHYREHGTLRGFEPEYVASFASMNHDDLHRQNIRSLLGEAASQEQVERTLEARRSGATFTHEAEAFRNQLTEQADVAQNQLEQQNYQSYVEEIGGAVSSLTNAHLGGVEFTPELRAYVNSQLTDRSQTGAVAPFIAALADPNQLSLYAAKALLYDSVVEAFVKQQGIVRQRTVSEVLGLNGNNRVNTQGAAPAGSGRAAATANGHKMTNEEIEMF